MIELKVSNIIPRSADVWSFFMKPVGAAPESFTAGQVAVLEIEGYSQGYIAFASAPTDENYEFLVKRSPVESALAKGLFDLKDHARVLLNKIVGHGFPAEKLVRNDLLFVGMGTGIAPLRSVARELLSHRDDFGSVVFLHGARTGDDLYYSEEIEAEWPGKGIETRRVLSQPTPEWSGDTGHVQNVLEGITERLTDPVALICGSNEMMKQTRERLESLGFSGDRILTNY